MIGKYIHINTTIKREVGEKEKNKRELCLFYVVQHKLLQRMPDE